LLERKFHAIFAPGNETTKVPDYHQGARVLPMVLSLLRREQKYVGTKVPVTNLS